VERAGARLQPQRTVVFLPNLLAEVAVFMVRK
jgi:hypothetical protein